MAKATKAKEVKAKPVKKGTKEAKTAKITKSTKPTKLTKATKPVKSPVKAAKAKAAKKPVGKAVAVKSQKTGSKRQLNDAKIAKLQKMYNSKKHSAKSLCEEFGISMATLFNYLKVKV